MSLAGSCSISAIFDQFNPSKPRSECQPSNHKTRETSHRAHLIEHHLCSVFDLVVFGEQLDVLCDDLFGLLFAQACFLACRIVRNQLVACFRPRRRRQYNVALRFDFDG